MQKAKIAVLLGFKRLLWPLVLTWFSINSVVYAGGSSLPKENHHTDHSAPDFITSAVTDVINTMSINALAWVSLSTLMVILFLGKNQPSKQSKIKIDKAT